MFFNKKVSGQGTIGAKKFAHDLGTFSSPAQGTIEYLVIIAIVIVIALVVVGLLTGFIGSGSSVASDTGKIAVMTASIGITESMVSNDGNFAIKLVNNTGDVIIISNVSIGDSNIYFSESLAQSGSKYFKVETNNVCEEGKIVQEDVVITYVTRHGITKTERYPSKVFFDCTPYIVNQANLASSCVSQASTIEPNLLPRNISSRVSLFGVTGYLGLHSGQASCVRHNGSTWVVTSSCSDVNVPLNQDATIYSNRDFLENRFVASTLADGNKIVRDTWFGLMWQDGKSASTMDWNNAMNYCNNWNANGYTNWRLATVAEAYSIFDYGKTGNSCVSAFTDGCYSSWTWTSTSRVWSPTNSYVYFPNGGTIISNDKTVNHYARCVRSEN